MEKTELLRRIEEAFTDLGDAVATATLESSFRGEKGKRELLQYELGIASVVSSIREVRGVVENPEVGKQYGLLHPIKNIRARKATERAREALERSSEDRLRELYDKARGIRSMDLIDSLAFYACAVTSRAGLPMTEEEQAKLIPLERLTEVLVNFYDMIKSFQPVA